MSSLATLFEPPDDATAEDLRGRLRALAELVARKRVEDVLREADRRKDEFLATLSHELRNPLAPIRNAVELMRRAGRDPDITERALAIMERQLHQLVRLTDDLLDVSRITRDTIELRRDHIDLRAVLLSPIEAIEPLNHSAGHDVASMLPDTSIWVDADFTRLAQAFVNLLNNAAKYTDRGARIEGSVVLDAGEAVI